MKILYIAKSHSVHTAHWIRQVRELSGWELHLFPVYPGEVHPDLSGVTVHRLLRRRDADDQTRQMGLWWPFARGQKRIESVLGRCAGGVFERPARLARVIRKLRPDVIHSLEMQHAGYLALASLQCLPAGFCRPPWIHSCWGSDIFFFANDPAHAPRIRRVLETCDGLITDCHRDVELARRQGFRGPEPGIFPVSGAYDLKRMRALGCGTRTSLRKIVLLKGQHNDSFAGRALVGIEAFKRIKPELRGFQVKIYSATPNVGLAAAGLRDASEIDIEVLGPLHRDQMIKLAGEARVSTGLSVSDGTPNSMLEAMTMGAFPVQSDTVSTGEWIEHGRNGMLVPAEDPQAVAAGLRRALTDDVLVDAAADLNAQRVQAISIEALGPKIIEAYQRAAALGRAQIVQSGAQLA